MLEDLEKLMLAGIGAFSLTREKAEKVYDDLVRRGQEQRQSREGFVKDLMDSADRTRKDMESFVTRQVKRVVEDMNLPSREDLARLEAKIDQLLARGEHVRHAAP